MIHSQWPEKVAAVFAGRPADAILSTTEIAASARLRASTLSARLKFLSTYGIVAHHSTVGRSFMWTRGPVEDQAAAIAQLREDSFAVPVDSGSVAMRHAKETQQDAMVCQLRDLMLDGSTTVTGDPLRLLSEALDVARLVRAAKLRPGGRFSGAEVDVMVARELRHISEAAERARDNLRQALDMMLA